MTFTTVGLLNSTKNKYLSQPSLQDLDTDPRVSVTPLVERLCFFSFLFFQNWILCVFALGNKSTQLYTEKPDLQFIIFPLPPKVFVPTVDMLLPDKSAICQNKQQPVRLKKKYARDTKHTKK